MSEHERYFPRWRQSLAASLYKSRTKPQSKYFQFANVNLEGFAQNRTLVFRGFDQHSNDLLAITDQRSAKYKECSQHPHAQIAWYFDASREQYRINCQTKLVDSHSQHQTLRNRVWTDLSDNAKSQFYWPSPADTFSNKSESLFDMDLSQIDTQTPPSTFVVLLLAPDYVDYLDLKTRPQTREVHKISMSAQADGAAMSTKVDKKTDTKTETVLWDWVRVNP